MYFVNRGYEVTVLTTVPNYPSGIIPLEYRKQVIQQEVRDGIRIVRVWSYVSPNKGFLRRILAQLSFGCLAPFLGGKAVGRPDVIIVESPPLFDAIAGRMMAWLKHCPFIFTVSDLWPESAIQLGMLRNRILIRLAEWLEWSTYQRADAVWALTAGNSGHAHPTRTFARACFFSDQWCRYHQVSPVAKNSSPCRAWLG